MPLTPFKLPAGMYNNGTENDAAGRWRTGNLVRWRSGILMPVHGWRTRANLPVGFKKGRGSVAWRDNSNDRYMAIGTANALYVMQASNTVLDITPAVAATLTPGLEDADENLGMGGGFYGLAGFGTPRPEGATLTEAATWMLDNWGQNLVGCMREDGRIWEWAPGGAEALVVTNAPTGCSGLLVTEERFLVALAPDRNPRRVEWSDQENNTLWTPASTNQAGGWELKTSGEIVTALRTRGQSLIITDNDAHTMTFSGSPFVYAFEQVGSSCGCVARLAAASVDRGVFWMGPQSFYHYNGGAVEEIPCEVSDFVFLDINWSQGTKIHAVAETAYGEIWWFYPSSNSNECDRYVVYNYAEGHWMTGEMARTTGVDAGAFANPIRVAPDGVIASHEGGYTFDGALPWVQSGPISLGAGDQIMVVDQILPDEKNQGDTTITFKARYYPNGAETSHGPYSLANPTSVRFSGRQVGVRIDATRVANWRVGPFKLGIKPGGER